MSGNGSVPATLVLLCGAVRGRVADGAARSVLCCRGAGGEGHHERLVQGGVRAEPASCLTRTWRITCCDPWIAYTRASHRHQIVKDHSLTLDSNQTVKESLFKFAMHVARMVHSAWSREARTRNFQLRYCTFQAMPHQQHKHLLALVSALASIRSPFAPLLRMRRPRPGATPWPRARRRTGAGSAAARSRWCRA